MSRYLEIIISHRMEKLVKKGHAGIISQLHSIQAVETPPVHPKLQSIISHHHTIFQNPLGLPASHSGHENSIPLMLVIIHLNVFPYHHPFD